MKYLLDTCVLSEGVRSQPSSKVAAWIKRRDGDELYVSVVTAGEIRFGIEALPFGRRRSQLDVWYDAAVKEGLEGRILPFDCRTALLWGTLRAKYPNAKTADSQIAATAFAHGLVLVTRNTKDFRFDGLTVINPWEEG